MKQLEIELKTLLKKDDYNHLKKQFAHIAPVHQKNYYIDTPDFQLREKKVAMRIRTFADWAELTLKVPQTVGNMEYNQKLTLPEAESYLEKQKLPQGLVLEKLAKIGIESRDWLVLGCLSTLRYETKTEIGLMALDESQYFDQTDYELELEVTDHEKGKEDFRKFLDENHITYQKAPSKLIRFIKSMKKS
ncbi:adenylate cyclase [Streptococcus sp. oral taxon 071 str. 73H25AP]|uniref:CYTH domain-containing protein n=1 Tax=Streptococcus sp. oral taxon 071 TaxID=712630 RepID=UPI0001E1019A|nr:CYTH domain-containing protein [Streptococcus sp. oral taxon 071]EFM35565.1 adenylate cyclase [Streptococcus sp. oral taxon 071 str. 73H25AP]